MSVETGISLETLAAKAPEAAEFMRHFSNANRLMLLCYIAQREAAVSDIQEELGIKQPALSQQLAELRQAGLVKTRRQSRQVFYSIADGRAEAVMKMLFRLFCNPGSKLADEATSAPLTEPAASSLGGAAHFARIIPPA
ncbi:ArsR/SmtB family transcription factor [Ensifer adhaerens]|uniref:Metalloregulator ArsR/SmtB family transcription factor n=1 Tax=Ensifer adhaerens TaxID=106592 RepID=A0A9Q8YEF0_ENSAD|nr:metalloregulator ArsR/SmtB family transcription factor [Ensifer adhaerens]USJ27377.1 metalloregulator ArsR/SmtB family transcription factor [Ensifer adhaerens]UTV41033.1 metalloregulator ArsR/SmtB family transcription factor [Ensifer adhaerens]